MTEREQVKLEIDELKVWEGLEIKVNGEAGLIHTIKEVGPGDVYRRVMIQWLPKEEGTGDVG